jgi:putative ABC transport system permease protein
MTRADGVSDEEFRVAVDAEIEAYGIGELQDRDEFIDGRGDIIDQTLSFIYGLLGLSVIIAIFGIVSRCCWPCTSAGVRPVSSEPSA